MIKGAYEYEPKKYFVLVNNQSNLIFLDLTVPLGQVNDSLPNPSGDKIFYCVKPIPDFHSVLKPYLFVKDRSSITLVNTKTQQVVKALMRCPFQWDVIRMYTMMVEQ